MQDAIVWRTAVETGRLIRSGVLTSRAVTEAHLDRIAALNPELQAYVTVTAELARQQADACDAEIAAGRSRGPLHGVPYCLKDIIETAGIRTTVGSTILADWVPTRDATVVARMREAGAVLLGKVNTHEFAFGGTTQTIHGSTRNPWDRSRIPGGSSGGSAAAIAAGLAPLSIGSDTAGSIRMPASFCGIAGFKPSYGLVSAAGVVAQSYSADHVGPMARAVEDLAAAMTVLAGQDAADPTALTGDPPGFALREGGGMQGLRVGIPRELMDFPMQPEIARLFESALEVMRGLGAQLGEISIPLLGRASWINGAIVLAETAAQHLEWGRTWFTGRPIVYGEDVAMLLARGRAVPATDFIEAARLRVALRQALAQVFADGIDLLAVPTQAITAPRIGEQSVVLGGRDIDMLDAMIHFLCGFSLTGLPALSLPMGLAGGLPAGLQLIGPSLRDAAVLQAGLAMQQATGSDRLRPGISTDGGT